MPVLKFDGQQEFEDWLEANYTDQTGYWVRLAKKASAKTSISYEQAREAALMYGWIDGLTHRLDDDYYVIKFCHRRPKSNWSDINIALVKMLIKEGKMKPEGLAEVEKAKADGRWNTST